MEDIENQNPSKQMPQMPQYDSVKAENLTSYDKDAGKEIKKPLVRVFVATYNQAKYIRDCLNGILMQKTDFPFEICIYDDCSTDGTSDIAREYAEKYPNIIADIQPENLYSDKKEQWHAIVFRRLKEHNCKYLAFCEGDDYWTDPFKLQIQADFLENHSDFSMCTGGVIRKYESTGKEEIDMVARGQSIGFEYDFYFSYLNYAVHTLTRMIRVDAIPEYEITLKYKYFRDVHLAYYILKKGKGYYFKRIFGVYNQLESGVFANLNSFEKLDINRKVLDELYYETRDEEQLKDLLLSKTKGIIASRSKTEKERIYLLKEFMQKYPEFSASLNIKL
jgi:glycosyltransferase involved in cell wall biosynthesis